MPFVWYTVLINTLLIIFNYKLKMERFSVSLNRSILKLCEIGIFFQIVIIFNFVLHSLYTGNAQRQRETSAGSRGSLVKIKVSSHHIITLIGCHGNHMIRKHSNWFLNISHRHCSLGTSSKRRCSLLDQSFSIG